MLSHTPAGSSRPANVAFSRASQKPVMDLPNICPHSVVNLMNNEEGVRILLGTYGKSRTSFLAVCDRMRTEDFLCLRRIRNLVAGIEKCDNPPRAELIDTLHEAYRRQLSAIKERLGDVDWKEFLVHCRCERRSSFIYDIAAQMYPADVLIVVLRAGSVSHIMVPTP